MKYYKQIEDDYIILIGTNCGGVEISEEEYNNIMNIIQNRLQCEDGYDYKLKTDLTFELYKLPVFEEEMEK